MTPRRNDTIARGQNIITMTNSGNSCGTRLYIGEASGQGAQMGVSYMELRQPPANGTVTIAPPRFQYLPRPGFIGADRFVILVPGQVEMTYTVNVVTPDQAR